MSPIALTMQLDLEECRRADRELSHIPLNGEDRAAQRRFSHEIQKILHEHSNKPSVEYHRT